MNLKSLTKSTNTLYLELNNIILNLENEKKQQKDYINLFKNSTQNTFIETKHKIFLRKLLLQILIKFQKNYNNNFQNLKKLPIYEQSLFTEINNKIIKTEIDIKLINNLIVCIQNEFELYFNNIINTNCLNETSKFFEYLENSNNFLNIYESFQKKNFLNTIPTFQQYILEEIFLFKQHIYSQNKNIFINTYRFKKLNKIINYIKQTQNLNLKIKDKNKIYQLNKNNTKNNNNIQNILQELENNNNKINTKVFYKILNYLMLEENQHILKTNKEIFNEFIEILKDLKIENEYKKKYKKKNKINKIFNNFYLFLNNSPIILENNNNINQKIENILDTLDFETNNYINNTITFNENTHTDFLNLNFYNKLINYDLNVNNYILNNMQNTIKFTKTNILKEIKNIIYKSTLVFNKLFYEKHENYNVFFLITLELLHFIITFMYIIYIYGFYILLILFSLLTYYFNTIFSNIKKKNKEDILSFYYLHSKKKLFKYIEFSYFNYINYCIYITFQYTYKLKYIYNLKNVFKFLFFYLILFFNKIILPCLIYLNFLIIKIKVYNIPYHKKIKFIFLFLFNDIYYYIKFYRFSIKIKNLFYNIKNLTLIKVIHIIKKYNYFILTKFLKFLHNIRFLHNFGLINYYYLKYKNLYNTTVNFENSIKFYKNNINQEIYEYQNDDNIIHNSVKLKKKIKELEIIREQENKNLEYFIKKPFIIILNKYKIFHKSIKIAFIIIYLIILISFSINFPVFFFNNFITIVIIPLFNRVSDFYYNYTDLEVILDITSEIIQNIMIFSKKIIIYLVGFPFNSFMGTLFLFFIQTIGYTLYLILKFIISIFISPILLFYNFIKIIYINVFNLIILIALYPINFIYNTFLNLINYFYLHLYLKINTTIFLNIKNNIYNFFNSKIVESNKINNITIDDKAIEILQYFENNYNYMNDTNQITLLTLILVYILIQSYFFFGKKEISEILYNNYFLIDEKTLIFSTFNKIELNLFTTIQLLNLFLLAFIIYIIFYILKIFELKSSEYLYMKLKVNINIIKIPEITNSLTNKYLIFDLINLTIIIYNNIIEILLRIIFITLKTTYIIILIFINFISILIYTLIYTFFYFFKTIKYYIFIKKFKFINIFNNPKNLIMENHNNYIHHNIVKQQFLKAKKLILNNKKINQKNLDNELFNLFIFQQTSIRKSYINNNSYIIEHNLLEDAIYYDELDLYDMYVLAELDLLDDEFEDNTWKYSQVYQNSKTYKLLKNFNFFEYEKRIKRNKYLNNIKVIKKLTYENIKQIDFKLNRIKKLSKEFKLKYKVEENFDNVFMYLSDIFINIFTIIQKYKIFKYLSLCINFYNLKYKFYYNLIYINTLIIYISFILKIFSYNLTFNIIDNDLEEDIDIEDIQNVEMFSDFFDYFNDKPEHLIIIYLIIFIYFIFTKKLEYIHKFTNIQKLITLSIIFFICYFYYTPTLLIILSINFYIIIFRKFLKKKILNLVIPYNISTKNLNLTYYLIKQLPFTLICILIVYTLWEILNIEIINDISDNIFIIFWTIFFLLFYNFIELSLFLYIYFTIIYQKKLLKIKKDSKIKIIKKKKKPILNFIIFLHLILFIFI
jgi:hypothetical protein